MNGIIYFSEKNIHGAWVIYGKLGIRQYYDYTLKEAKHLYRQEYSREYFINQ